MKQELRDLAAVTEIAKEVLPTLERIANAAKSHLVGRGHFGSGLINPSDLAVRNLLDRQTDVYESYVQLTREPAIARVSATDTGGSATYYICRQTPVHGLEGVKLASYRSPIGRLAALQVGDVLTQSNGRDLRVDTHLSIRPVAPPPYWDSARSVYKDKHASAMVIESLRALLGPALERVTDVEILQELLREEELQANVHAEIRREVIRKMALRDQPILDQFQDSIFRLPLNTRLALLGPPGTGKTTTLIRRLGQKLDFHHLTEDEQQLVGDDHGNRRVDRASDWIMFSPTDLLRHYLKEAFAREGIAAPDHNVRTWFDFRRELGKNAFGVLRSQAGTGHLVLRDELNSLLPQTVPNQTAWFEDFSEWQQEAAVHELREAAAQLKQSSVTRVARLADDLETAVARPESAARTSISALKLDRDVDAACRSLADSSRHTINASLEERLRQDKRFLERLAEVLQALDDEASGAEAVDVASTDDFQDEEEAEDDDTIAGTGQSIGPIRRATRAYTNAVRAEARAAAGNRSVSATTKSAAITSWAGWRSLDRAELTKLGDKLSALAQLRKFDKPIKRYVDGIARRYLQFRRARRAEARWYTSEAVGPTEVSPLELDCILLEILTELATFGADRSVMSRVRSEAAEGWLRSTLDRLESRRKTQILVDEATDFSPVQLACMAVLAKPATQSLFLCGDFNQRLTAWGTSTEEDLRWALPELETREIWVGYRQSKELFDFSSGLIRRNDRIPSEAASCVMGKSGFGPALLEHADHELTSRWLADRIREVERQVGELPSTAIFVLDEAQVELIAASLKRELAVDNIDVIACTRGMTIGRDGQIRVFDVQHIKGLEFECAFFVGVDELEQRAPDLLEKYLYVGATRAATFFGVTCRGALPRQLAEMRSSFIPNWET